MIDAVKVDSLVAIAWTGLETVGDVVNLKPFVDAVDLFLQLSGSESCHGVPF